MRKLRAWLCRLAGVFNREKREAELAEEIESHLHMHIDDNLRSGMAPEEARRLALIKLGGIAPTQESYRDHLGFPFFEALVDDLRYSIRMLRKTPAFTTVALVTLILGIGANTAIFSVIYELFLRGLRVPQPDQLALITYDNARFRTPLSLEMVNAIRQRTNVFTGVVAWANDSFHVTENGSVNVVEAGVVNGEALSTLQLQPALGRFITPSDDQPGGGPEGWVAVVTHEYWQQHFHGDRSILGHALLVESMPLKVIGVLPPGFNGVTVGSHPSIVVPLAFKVLVRRTSDRPLSSGDLIFTTIGRMKPGENLAHVRAAIDQISNAVIQTGVPRTYREVFFPEARLGVSPGQKGDCKARDVYQPSLLILQGLVGIILLLCSANLSGLFSARVAARARDMTLRCALGAKRVRLTRQLFTEVLLLASVAAPCALLFARITASLLIANLIRPRYNIDLQARLDIPTFMFNAGMALTSVLVAGLIPALQATRMRDCTGRPDSASPMAVSLARSRYRFWLVPVQAGISVVLVAIAGLFAGTLYRLLTVNLGFDPRGVLIIPTDFQKRHETPKRRLALYHQLLDDLNAAPGIQVASAETVPVLQNIYSNVHLALRGQHSERLKDINISYNRVANRYFEAMGISLVQGRGFSSSDEQSEHPVCILSESAARHLFPSGNAVGSHLGTDDDVAKSAQYEIIGVVKDIKFRNLRDASSDQIYLLFQPGNIEPELSLVIKTNDMDVAIASARSIFNKVLSDSPFLEPIAEIAQLKESIAQERVIAALSALFGILALLLTAIGVYGTLAFQVTQSTMEIGVRLALGASQAGVLRMVLKQALLPVAIGASLGTMAALTSSRLIMSLLFEVQPYSPPIYLGALLIIGAICFVAAWMPARRAAGIDPIMALRCE